MDRRKPEWMIILDMLSNVDVVILNRIMRRMMYYLYTSNVKEISHLINELTPNDSDDSSSDDIYSNMPNPKIEFSKLKAFTDKVFQIARNNLPHDEISRQLKLWLNQERSRFLSTAVENMNLSLNEITEVLDRFMNIPRGESYLSPDEFINIRVALTRRFLSNNLRYINIAKHYIKVINFHSIVQNTVGPSKGAGKLGGKSAGLILAHRILKNEMRKYPELKNIDIPKSWYISSDTIMSFIHYNALEEFISLKYKETDQIRAAYPYVQQLFKNSYFPKEIIKQLENLLDKIGEKPIIVRSSSLLEDSFDAAFAGKYKSLFLANHGDKQQRLSALTDAIAEIYASIFGPDPIEYRKERKLLDFQEEMGILVQEVVGTKIGKYFFPSYAGVAFTNNEFRWSSRIRREDGIIRLVAGLGTRAVDRVGDDYPYLVSPGQPGLRVNLTENDVIKYSQRKIDVMNLETNEFETHQIDKMFEECSNQIPAIEKIISVDNNGSLTPPASIMWDMSEGSPVVTFHNLIEGTPFLKEMKIILDILTRSFEGPVDVEFASDGQKLYILQCRPQTSGKSETAREIPFPLDREQTLFEASKYITTGYISDLEYLVYVSPEMYSSMPDIESMKRVASTVSLLNKRIKRKKFILIGPGRWGSRGDIKLGVPIVYSDINNTAMLIELAYSKDGYVPELSFGTHFFLDLVEANIKYLPIYPDQEGNYFDKELFNEDTSVLKDIVPEADELMQKTVIVTAIKDLPSKNLSIIMNGDTEKAVAFFSVTDSEGK